VDDSRRTCWTTARSGQEWTAPLLQEKKQIDSKENNSYVCPATPLAVKGMRQEGSMGKKYLKKLTKRRTIEKINTD